MTGPRMLARLCTLVLLLLATMAATPSWAARPVSVIDIDGAITPITVRLLAAAIERAQAEGSQALVVQLNTPGGLERSMRSMVQSILNSEIPIVVYVAPNPKTHYEQQLRETRPIGPGTLSPHVKRIPTPAEARAASDAKTPPRGKELRDVLNSSLATMRSLENRNSGPQPLAAELVPIQDLLYKGQRAIERAAEIRRALKKSGTPPTRALVDELVDLVELAAAE